MGSGGPRCPALPPGLAGETAHGGVPPSQPRPVCVTGGLVRAHCSLSWEPEWKDGSSCSDLTGESGAGGVWGVCVCEKGVSERRLRCAGAAARGCGRRNRSAPAPPGWAFGVLRIADNGDGERGGERSGDDATCLVLMESPCEEAVDFRCRVDFIVNIEDATALRSGVRPARLRPSALPPASGACAGQKLQRARAGKRCDCN